MFVEVAVDRGLEVDQGMKDAAFESAAGEFGKEPFDRVEPRGRGRDEMERPARVPGEPSAHFGMLEAGVIVEDHVDQPAGRDVAFETVQEAEKLLVPMALHTLAGHRAVEHIEGGKQSGRAVSDVIVSHRPGAPALHRQAGLGVVEGLDLALFVDREHQAVRRRVDVKPDHIAQFVDKLRIAAELEDPQLMRGEAMGVPDLLHGADRQPHRGSHRAAGPVGGLARRWAECARDQLHDDRFGDRRLAGLARLVVQQPVDAGLHEAALPAPYAGLRDPGSAHDLRRAKAFGGGQDDPRPPHMFLGTFAIGHDRFQPLPIPRSKPDFNIPAHP